MNEMYKYYENGFKIQIVLLKRRKITKFTEQV